MFPQGKNKFTQTLESFCVDFLRFQKLAIDSNVGLQMFALFILHLNLSYPI
jgi:hypothetical protein